MPKDDWAKAKRGDAARAVLSEQARASAYRRAIALRRAIESRKAKRANAAGPPQDRKPRPEPNKYHVRAGTACHIRREGEKGWRPHVTREALRFDGYAWRNEGWYGFKRQGWEMKVSAEMVRFGRAERGVSDGREATG